MRRPVNCGTYGGYQTHRRRGEEPCGACRRAQADYMRARRTRPEVRNQDAAQSSAYDRAERRLREAHREEFESYYAEERGR